MVILHRYPVPNLSHGKQRLYPACMGTAKHRFSCIFNNLHRGTGGETARHSGVVSPAALIKKVFIRLRKSYSRRRHHASTHCILSHPVMMFMMGGMIWGL